MSRSRTAYIKIETYRGQFRAAMRAGQYTEALALAEMAYAEMVASVKESHSLHTELSFLTGVVVALAVLFVYGLF